ncbi:MAG: hypothetical protein ACRDZN_05490 [Acidimicrobiales bacterium]
MRSTGEVGRVGVVKTESKGKGNKRGSAGSGRRGAAAMTAASLDSLRKQLRSLNRVVVAFSGGADSPFLAWMAHDTLGIDRVLAVTAASPSLPATERGECRELAAEWGQRWREVETDELTHAAYARNDANRASGARMPCCGR